MTRLQRLDKILSNMGIGSRKEVKQLVKKGAVEIDGIIINDSSKQVNPHCEIISINGEKLEYKEYVYIMLNKPQGVISATEDNREKTVVDILSEYYRTFSVSPVGRLDKDTEGLLLLTNNGKLTHELLSPKKHVPKKYFAKIEGIVDEKDVNVFRQGIILDDGYKTMGARLNIIQSANISSIEVTIYEGKFHQVKRMFAACGKKVIYLKRISMGELKLDESLDLGHYRELNDIEFKLLTRNIQDF